MVKRSQPGSHVPSTLHCSRFAEQDTRALAMAMTEEDIKTLIPEIKDYLITHGSLLKLVRYEEVSTVQARPVGVSIAPTKFPRSAFDQAQRLQPSMSELYIRAASNESWLEEVFRPLLKQDAFLSSLWDIWLKVKAAGVVQDVVCGIFRSDYMLHGSSKGESPAIKQVEMNTFSVAGAYHAQTTARMHKHISREQNDTTRSLPENNNITSIVSMLSQIHHLYQPKTSHPLCILMVVQPQNFNIADERPIEYSLWDRNIPCYRCEWNEVLSQTTLTPDRTLLYGNTFEVSTIYYRAGYEASEYLNHDNPRLHLELSRSIKCPDILTHLTTFKSVQAALTRPGALEHFLPSSPSSANQIRETFMPMHPLSSTTTPTSYSKYVLKPNLEGGSHNIYPPSIGPFISTLKKSEYPNYTLMELIKPPPTTGILMTPGEIYAGEVISELGILGTVIWNRRSGEVFSNDIAGWTFKTKPAEINEMSVVKGYGCFDCPDLTEREEQEQGTPE
ncbi:Glutathione synthetase, partial [Pseudocercospora fuligena]